MTLTKLEISGSQNTASYRLWISQLESDVLERLPKQSISPARMLDQSLSRSYVPFPDNPYRKPFNLSITIRNDNETATSPVKTGSSAPTPTAAEIILRIPDDIHLPPQTGELTTNITDESRQLELYRGLVAQITAHVNQFSTRDIAATQATLEVLIQRVRLDLEDLAGRWSRAEEAGEFTDLDPELLRTGQALARLASDLSKLDSPPPSIVEPLAEWFRNSPRAQLAADEAAKSVGKAPTWLGLAAIAKAILDTLGQYPPMF